MSGGGFSALFHSDNKISTVSVVPPQDGGWSLTPMENLLLGLRTEKRPICLELYGVDGAVFYQVRTVSSDALAGMFNSYFPQSRVKVSTREPGAAPDPSDWLNLAEDEQSFVQTVHLGKEPFLPLRIFDDNRIRESAIDPLAGVIGLLASSTSHSSEAGADRMGIRLLIRPAPENWGSQYQSRMQKRRDGDDRVRQQGSTPADTGPPTPMIILGGVLFGAVFGNYWLWDSGMSNMLLPFNMAAAVGIGGGLWLAKKFSGGRARDYLDEELIEKKLKSLAFHSELQVVRIYRHVADEHTAYASIDNMLHCIGSFDDPAGNSWKPGKLRTYTGQEILRDEIAHPFRGGTQELSWLDGGASKKSLLSARESASVWHLPLGTDEMASMERVASTTLIPYLADLVGLSGEAGPTVGIVEGKDTEIRLPESAIRKHTMILGKSGVGKSTLIKHVVGHKLEKKAAGEDNSAVVVVDPHSDLVHDILTIVPPEIVDKVRLVDFGRDDRVPGLNLLDPALFPNRDRCVDTIVTTVRYLWDTWGNRLEDLLKKGLSIIYEYNSHPDTPREKMMTILDILKLLDDGDTVGSGPNAKTVMSTYQRSVLNRCTDPRLEQWFESYLNWPRDTRAEAVGPVHSRVGAYASNERASVVMGMRESTITFDSVLSEGLVLLVATASGTIGNQPAALMGGTVISLLESAIRDQEKLAAKDRRRCLLVVDEFQTVTGANWEGMFAEIRKYGCSMMLATQSLARLDTGERKLRSGIMGNVGCIVAHQMAAEDAALVAPEMDAERVQVRDLVNLNPHGCIVRINSDTTCYPAFSMKTLPPPDSTRGSDEFVDAVIAASEVYTVDFETTRDAMNAEVAEVIARSKKGSEGDSPYSGRGGNKPSGRGGPKSGGDPAEGAPDRLADMLSSLRGRRLEDGEEEPAAAVSAGAGSASAPRERPGSSPVSEASSSASAAAPPAPSGDPAGRPSAAAEERAAATASPPRRSGSPSSLTADPDGGFEAVSSGRFESPLPEGEARRLPDFSPPPQRRSGRSPDPSLDRDLEASPERDPEPPESPDAAVSAPAASSPAVESGSVAAASPVVALEDEPGAPSGGSPVPSSGEGDAPRRSVPVTRSNGRPEGVIYSPLGTDLTGVRRIESGPLRGIPAVDIENSEYSRDYLEDLMRNSNHDTGIRRVLDKRSGDHVGKLRKQAERDGLADAREKASADLEEALRLKDIEMEEAVARAREDALAQARRELGVQAGSGAPSGSPAAAVLEREATRSRSGHSNGNGGGPERGSRPGGVRSGEEGGSFGYDSIPIDEDLQSLLEPDDGGTDLAVPASGEEEAPAGQRPRRPSVIRRR